MYREMKRQLESVRHLKMRKHNFLKQLNEISYLINIRETDVFVDKVNDITDKLINLHYEKSDLEKKILEVDMEFSSINNFIKEENNIDIFNLVINSDAKDKSSYLEKLNEVGLVSVKEYETIKEFLWNEDKRRRQSYQLPKWI